MKTLRNEVYDRMDGDHTVSAMQIFLEAAETNFMELREDGFEHDEIIQFLSQKLDEFFQPL